MCRCCHFGFGVSCIRASSGSWTLISFICDAKLFIWTNRQPHRHSQQPSQQPPCCWASNLEQFDFEFGQKQSKQSSSSANSQLLDGRAFCLLPFCEWNFVFDVIQMFFF
ncbi:uncharacterized protein DMAD_07914 [Drosophila madeirensis]|uniref:Uncharacterized protein n=1 Tax=Drosophila madeirensis TaxID=30013 RepID=A0AAU9ERD0_DROMD